MLKTTDTTKHDAHVKAHDDLLVRATTGARGAEDFVATCGPGYRPSVYAGLSGSRLADVLDAEFARVGDARRCWRGPVCPGDDVAARDEFIAGQLARIGGAR